MSTAVAAPVKFHLSLNVSDLKRSIAFYRVLFGTEPAKQRADYAKFELDEPPVVLSLEPHAAGRGGALNHLGIRLADSATLVEMQRRLELAGISSQREEGVECCYARQTKFWVHDPDQTLWEFYVLEGDIDHRGAGQIPERVLPKEPLAVVREAARAEWEHRLGDDIPKKLRFADESLDEVRLRGTFNVFIDEQDRAALLSEVRRVLRPAGRILLHVLTADRAIAGELSLAGPAAKVKHAPVDRDLLRALEAAGFAGIQLTKYGASPCFEAAGAEMRETMIMAVKPEAASNGDGGVAVYRGPFRAVTDESGHTWPRGERVAVCGETWGMLQQPPYAEHFTCLSHAAAEACRTQRN
jgi:catechol 2,3-dioxygenase-like lactoylglutathione lyase family enzyme